MKQRCFYFFIFLFLSIPAQLSAREIVYYGLDNKGESHYINRDLISFETNMDLLTAEHELKYYYTRLTSKPNLRLQTLTDYTVRLMRIGKVKEALEVFRQLSAKFPKEHVFHAYLSMAYELNGDNQNALKHAKKSLQLNQYTHEESQWISIRILEAKIALEKNPGYLKNHSVLSLTTEQKKSDKVRNQLLLQLKERFPYSRENDPVMADLLKDLGDCFTETQSYEYAAAFYEIAIHYCGSKDPELQQKIKSIASLRSQYANTAIVPKEQHSGPDFAVVKVKKLDYRELLLYYDKHPVEWKLIISDPGDLMEYVKDIQSTTMTVAQEAGPVEEEENGDSSVGIIILIAMAALIPVILFLRKRMLK